MVEEWSPNRISVFLSYTGALSPLAEQISLTLTNSGHEVFFDRTAVSVGNDYAEAISARLRATDLMIILIGPGSLEECEYARTALRLAQEIWPDPVRHVIPVMVDETSSEVLPNYLSGTNVLRPEGNLVAEVSAAVNDIASGNKPRESDKEQQRLIQEATRELGEISTAAAIEAIDREWERTKEGILSETNYVALNSPAWGVILSVLYAGGLGFLAFGTVRLLFFQSGWTLSLVFAIFPGAFLTVMASFVHWKHREISSRYNRAEDAFHRRREEASTQTSTANSNEVTSWEPDTYRDLVSRWLPTSDTATEGNSCQTQLSVFLSYASEQAPLAERIWRTLTESGHDVFFDRISLPPGHDYNPEIVTRLRASDLMIFLISPGSVEDGAYARTELRLAQEIWPDPVRHVIPVMVDETSSEVLPNYLSGTDVLRPEGNLVAEVSATVDNFASSYTETKAERVKRLEATIGQLQEISTERELQSIDFEWQATRSSLLVSLDDRPVEPNSPDAKSFHRTLFTVGAGFIVVFGIAYVWGVPRFMLAFLALFTVLIFAFALLCQYALSCLATTYQREEEDYWRERGSHDEIELSGNNAGGSEQLLATSTKVERLSQLKVFIAYGADQIMLAHRIHVDLSDSGHEVYIDRKSNLHERSSGSAVEAELRASDLLIFLVSPGSVDNGANARTELRVARDIWPHPAGHVLPVMASETPFDTIPNYLRAVTILRPGNEIERAVVAAVNGLALHYDPRQPEAERKKALVESTRRLAESDCNNKVRALDDDWQTLRKTFLVGIAYPKWEPTSEAARLEYKMWFVFGPMLGLVFGFVGYGWTNSGLGGLAIGMCMTILGVGRGLSFRSHVLTRARAFEAEQEEYRRKKQLLLMSASGVSERSKSN